MAASNVGTDIEGNGQRKMSIPVVSNNKLGRGGWKGGRTHRHRNEVQQALVTVACAKKGEALCLPFPVDSSYTAMTP
ncbi:MAG: hypothetical protein WCV99_17525 [Sterolibacterium sp.]